MDRCAVVTLPLAEPRERSRLEPPASRPENMDSFCPAPRRKLGQTAMPSSELEPETPSLRRDQRRAVTAESRVRRAHFHPLHSTPVDGGVSADGDVDRSTLDGQFRRRQPAESRERPACDEFSALARSEPADRTLGKERRCSPRVRWPGIWSTHQRVDVSEGTCWRKDSASRFSTAAASTSDFSSLG
jgi:hypothetical protein